MTAAAIDARFAGGVLLVDIEPLPYDDAEFVVTIAGPVQVSLTVLEARRLARALVRATHRAETRSRRRAGAAFPITPEPA